MKKQDYTYYDRHGNPHKKSRVISEYRHHRHRRRSTRKILITIGVVLLVLVVALVVSWRVLDALGKKRLYAASATVIPELPQEEIPEEEVQETTVREWKQGWIRYNGGIYEYNGNALNFLIMGIDKDGPVTPAADGISGGQADALFILSLDPDSREINIIAVNRNTVTDVDVYDKAGEYVGSQPLQLCLQHGYGDGMQLSCERQMSTVSKLFYNLPLHGYVSLNRNAIAELNDAIGGVTLEVLTDIPQRGKYPGLTKGVTKTLTGPEALRYIWYRDMNEFDSASDRLMREKQYLSAAIDKVKSAVKDDPSVIIRLYQKMTPYMVTSIDLSEATYLAGQAAGYSFDTDGILSMEGETILADTGFEEFHPDTEQLYALMVEAFYKEVKQ